MPNYDNSKIYKIVCRDTDLIYIGSTSNFTTRKSKHKSSYKSFINGKYTYTNSFRIIENNNYYFDIIEDLSCLNRRELELRERYWIEIYQKDLGDLVVNKCIPTRSRRERYLEERDGKCGGRNKIIARYVNRVRVRLFMRKHNKKILSKVGKTKDGRYRVISRYVSRVRKRLRSRKNALIKKEQNKS